MTVRNEAARILCVGVNHHSTPVDQRERFADLSSELSATEAVRDESVSECVLLSTCNRIEWYLAVDGETAHVVERFCARLAEQSGLPTAAIRDALTTYEGPDAIDHLLSVASGLESMVVGESEIMGQVSRAYMRAIDDNSLGPVLDALLRAAIRTGKRVRSETSLGSNPASVSSVALDLASKLLGDIAQQRILVIGAGEMGVLTHKLLRAHRAQNVILANRTLERAQSLAAPDWEARSLDDLPVTIAGSDLVISATGAPQPVVTSRHLEAALASRVPRPVNSNGAKPLVVIDLAVPRDVEPAVAALDGVTLLDLDGLNRAIDRALSTRENAIPAAREIIDVEQAALDRKLRELDVRPLVVELRSRAERIREQEVERTLRYLGEVEPDTVDHLQHLTRALVNKLLHMPTVRIKEMAHADQNSEYLSTVRDLFDLDGTASAP